VRQFIAKLTAGPRQAILKKYLMGLRRALDLVAISQSAEVRNGSKRSWRPQDVTSGLTTKQTSRCF
jgi:hypothetical protein